MGSLGKEEDKKEMVITQISIGGFDQNVSAVDLATFLERNAGMIWRCRLKTSWTPPESYPDYKLVNMSRTSSVNDFDKVAPHAFVHFARPEGATKAINASGKSELLMSGRLLRVNYNSESSFRVNLQRTTEHFKFSDICFEIGTLLNPGEFLVSWKGPERGVDFIIDPFYSSCKVLFTKDVAFAFKGRKEMAVLKCNFIVEFLVREIDDIRIFKEQAPFTMLIRLNSSPLLYYRTADDDVYDTVPFNLLDDDDPWIRTTDFTPDGIIGRCSSYKISFSPRFGLELAMTMDYLKERRIAECYLKHAETKVQLYQRTAPTPVVPSFTIFSFSPSPLQNFTPNHRHRHATMQGFPGTADLTQLHSTMQAIEQACSAIEMNVNLAAAEATIFALCQSSRPYLSCKFIMENSQLPIARFQAAGAIWNAALQEWGHLTYEEKKSLIIFCLQYVMEHTTATDAYVQAKVSAVAAQLLKRGWMEFSSVEKEAVFTQVKNAVLGIHGLDAQYSGLNFLESLVSEFSPSTSSAMGLPTEFHDQCRSLMEAYYLKSFYCWAQDAAMRMTEKVICCDASIKEDKIYSASLRLMFQILNWDFKDSTDSANRKSRQDVTLLKKYERTLVQPGQAWTYILITSGHITWLLGVYGLSRRKFSDDVLWFDSPLAVSSRQLIVQLCSLYGTVFPSDNGHTQQRYLLQILDAIIQWIFPPDDIINAIKNGQSESEMLDGCHALLSIATLCETTMMFDNLLKSLRPYGTLHLLSMLTSEVVKVAAENNEDITWCSEALDILLETWNILLVCVDCDKNTILEEGRGTCANLFNLIVDTHLKVAASTAFDDDDNYDHFRASVSTRDERLNSYALIARTAADCTLPFLIHHFSERVSLIYQEKGRMDPTRTLEELYWLLLMSGHILADSGEGETAMVPDALQASFAGISEAVHHPVVILSWAIIKFCEGCLDPDMRTAFFSPRLLEAAVWFLARWAGTYLMSSNTASNNQNSFARGTEPAEKSITSGHVLRAFAGDGSHGKTVLDTFVQISITTLVSYPGETELQTLTCCQLLPALVNRKNVCKHLVTLNSWQSLSNAFANNRILFSLSSRLQRFLAETLVRSASVIEEPSLLKGFVRDLMEPVTAYLTDMSSKNDLKAVAQIPDALLLVICLVERLRGAARATEPRTQKAIFDVALAIMNPLLSLMDIYKDEAVVISLTLKFGVDLVDGQVVFLSPEDTRILVGFCMQMLQIYYGHNVRKIALSLSDGLLNEAKTEKYKDLRALLKLLTNLCTKDLVDFSSAPAGEDIDIAQVVYFGLHIILPLMSLELLKFPKLSFQYFSLLSHMLEVYPEKVAQLSAESFGRIVETIDWGIHQQDLEVVSMCLRSVDALASYHYKERSAGKEGLGGHASVSLGSGGESAEGILRHFLRLLMQMLLFEDFSTDLHGAAADCLFPLLLCEQDLYQSLLQELMERQKSDALKLRLANAFKCLTSANQLDPSLNRINRQRFRKNFHKFLVDVSGFLRTK